MSTSGFQDQDEFGPYRVLDLLGEGGMGTVYAAEQRQPLQRRVALKVIKIGMDTREVLARFEVERQALALLDHPNIARVLDAGMTSKGRPFFAMELVRGVSIRRYCDTNRLPIPQRVELVLQACTALQHAHERGIVHRDIKPGNLLVTEIDGRAVVKVIDFGLAKAMNQRLTERTLFTEEGRIVGTPEYMSPEQAESSQQDVDHRTDVFSLGVVLYELIAGALPFDFQEARKKGYIEVQRVIREEEAPGPSRRISSLSAQVEEIAALRGCRLRELTQSLKRGLEAVTMKAIAKLRRDRYPSCEQFAADLRRFLAGEAVSARGSSPTARFWTRVRRFRRRFPMVVPIAVSAALGGSGVWWWMQSTGVRVQALPPAGGTQGAQAMELDAAKKVAAGKGTSIAERQARLRHLREALGDVSLRSVPSVLQDLAEMRALLVRGEGTALSEEELEFNSAVEQAYGEGCDRGLTLLVRKRLTEVVAERADREPKSWPEFEEMLLAVVMVMRGMDLSDAEIVLIAKKLLAAEWSTRIVDASSRTHEFDVEEAMRGRAFTVPVVAPTERSALEPLARRLLTLLDRAFDPATPWLPQGHLGYMIARQGVEESAIRVENSRDTKDYLRICDVYTNGLDAIEAMAANIKGGIVTNRGYLADVSQVVVAWQVLRQLTNQDADETNWAAMQRIDGFAQKFWNDYRTSESFALPTVNGPLGRFASKLQNNATGPFLAKVPFDAGRLGQLLKDVADRDACRAEPRATWTLRSVAPTVGLNVTRLNDVYKAKVRLMATQLAMRFPDWEAARAEFHRGQEVPAPDQLDQALLGTLARLRIDLEPYRLQDRQPLTHLARLMIEHLRAVEAAWAASKELAPAIDWSVPMALARLVAMEGLEPEVRDLAETLRWRYLVPHEERLQRDWLALPDGTAATFAYLTAANQHLTRLAEIDKAFENREAPRDDVDHVAWLQRLDGELSGRLQKHVEEQLAYWRPDTKWANLQQAIDAVQGALEAQAIRAKTLDAARSVKAPAADAPELRAGQVIAESPQLPRTTKALALLRGFVVPGVSDVQTHVIARLLTDLCGQLRTVLQDDRQLASIAVAFAPLAAAPLVMHTTDHYLRPLHDGLRERLVAEVRSRYLRTIERAVQLDGPELMNALYATSREEISSVVDQDVVRRLVALLAVDGRLDLTRRDYRMLPDAKEPAKPHLRPGKDFAGDAAEREWWRFEQFLVELQAFLAKGDPKIGNSVFRVTFELPRRSPGLVWDIATTKRPFCYYATHSAGRSEPGLVVFNKEWDRFPEPLQWEFQDTRRPTLWFLWTNRVRSEALQWPRDRSDDDIAYHLNGCLAPMQLAWSGTEDASWWTVTLQPDNTTEKAILRVCFADVDGVAVPLPIRPPRPRMF